MKIMKTSIKTLRAWCLTLLLLAVLASTAAEVSALELPREEALNIGRKIWVNECGGTVQGLTSWNTGENFASLGIGHFIWYPAGMEGPFDESFPSLLTYIMQRGAKIPEWLLHTKDCPWTTQEQFESERHGERMNSLRTFLKDTIDKQAEFAAKRLSEALPKMTQHLSPEQRLHVEKQFQRLAQSPGGYYPLMDYVNFKGEGIKETERYQGEGWGLLQVLSGLRGTEKGSNALNEFSRVSARILTRRVELSPPERNEVRWLKGWIKRCQTYHSNTPSS
jgi:hypothetical protein